MKTGKSLVVVAFVAFVVIALSTVSACTLHDEKACEDCTSNCQASHANDCDQECCQVCGVGPC